MSPKENKQQNLRKLVIKPTHPNARLIQNPETRFPREQAIAVDEAQDIINQLYRKDAEYGDGSSAFMVMKEQFEGGVGKDPKPIKKDTLHTIKCRQSITCLEKIRVSCRLSKLLPPEAKDKIQAEIQKMEEALQWTEQYRNGEDPEIPTWARPWRDQLGK
ncbi:hypothetical protein J0895_12270 [Phormidium pseudopriestleyi FRX01]|uniref:Uncharacterized protein n=1 Tax=Phormidium pseudopriestleyi FRX01 TaxID=1759528 RepID=A0ABS3FRX6_9CYAN|nr:hypothetical protein [Phormidium pseudopriestleyi]MBO0349874.1 hypothetical protein [Phormidium pseudopriestleyi FRX01]